MPHWLPAFLVAAVVTLAAVPRLRRVAVETELLSIPHRRSSHSTPVPYLGGVAVVLAVLAGALFVNHLERQGAVLCLVAALLGAVGLVDDDRTLNPAVELAVETGAALIAVALGVRLHASGAPAFDIALTLMWIVGVTNAFDLLDNVDGLAAGTGAAAALGIFLVALLAGQVVVAELAAAAMGACLAFLVFNWGPAWIFLGDAGTLFLGFLLAILSVAARAPLPGRSSFATAVILLSLPLLDATTVTFGRLRRGLRISRVRKDHLSDRLVARGLSRTTAVSVLIAVQLAMSVLAALATGGAVPLAVALLVAAAVLCVLVATTRGIEVYRHHPVRGLPRPVRWGIVAVLFAVPVFSAPAVASMARALAPARAGQAAANRATAALSAGDTAGAQKDFEQAVAHFAEADTIMSGPLNAFGLAVPGLSSNLAAAKTLASVGTDLSRAGAVVSDLAGPSGLGVQHGSVALDRVRAVAPALAGTSAVLDTSARRLRAASRSFLVAPVRRAVNDLTKILNEKRPTLKNAAEAAQLLPTILGQDQPRQYFIAFQNNSELRGAGGLVGNWGELTASGGHLALDRFGRLGDLQEALVAKGPAPVSPALVQRWPDFAIPTQWQQVNVSPDFSTTAQNIDRMYAFSGGHPVDGVIAIDPVGLSALLQLTGPVSVSSWPEPITAANVVDITLVQAYQRYPVQIDEQRIAFLSDLAHAVTEAFTNADTSDPARLIATLAPAVHGHHLMIYSKDPRVEKLLTDIGADGNVPSLNGDSLLVVNQNISANKIDTYLHRQLSYDVTVSPHHGTATVSGKVDVGLTNALPSLDLPYSVVGPYLPQFNAGENRSYVSVYSPFLSGPVSLDGKQVQVASHFDGDRPSKSVAVSIAAGETRTVTMPVHGEAELSPEGWYRLDLLRQPVLNADDVDLAVKLPSGWRVAEVHGAARTGRGGTTRIHLQLSEPTTIWLRIVPTGLNSLWDRLAS